MSQNGILNISRDDAGEGRRVFILKNGGSEANTSDGRGMAQLPRSPTINSISSQHGGSVSDNGRISNSDSDNVINGMLRSGDDVDPSSDLGADLQHIEEWLKTRSDSLSSFDFDPDIKPSEIDVSDFFNLKGGVQLNVGGQDYGLVLSKDGTSETSNSLQSQLSFPDLSDTLCGSSSRRNSFTKKLETLMQVDKGLFEELLLTDPNKKYGGKRVENGLSLPAEDRGLFEELLLPGGHEDWARHAQELLLAVSMEKKETEASDTSPVAEGGESLSGPMNCTVSLPETTQTESEAPDDLEMMVNNIQPIKLMSPQEIENMATRPLGFDETPIKTEEQRNREVSRRLEDEDFNFYPFGSRPSEDGSTLPSDLLTSPNSEVDSKLSSILAMDASNDPLEIQSPESGDMLESLSKTPPKLERSISPGTFLVKLEPRENQDLQNKTNQDFQNKLLTSTAVSSSTSSHTVAKPPLTSVVTATPPLPFSSFLPSSVLDVGDITTTAMSGAATSTVDSSRSPITANANNVINPITTQASSPMEVVNLAPKSLLKIPGLAQASVKKLPINMVQSKVAAPIASSNTVVTTSVSSTTTNTSSILPRPALIIRPLSSGQQQQQQQQQPQQQQQLKPQQSTVGVDGVSKEGTPLTLTPLKVVAVQPSNKPGTANVTITVDRKANLTTVNIVSSNNEHTLFKINTCDLVRAISSIREPHLDPLGLSPQQLLRSAHTAHRLIQEVHQQGAARQGKSSKDASSGPQNFEINQVLQEVKAPISRMQQGQLALLRQATAVGATAMTTTADQTNANKTEASNVITNNIIKSVSSSLVETATVVRSVTAPNVSLMPATQPTTVTGTVVSSGKSTAIKTSGQKISTDAPPVNKFSRLSTVTVPDKTNVKNEGVGVSLRPGAPPTMVSVPSVLDTLSASSLLSADLLQDSGQSTSSTKHLQNEDDINDENPEMCTVSDEVANKALEDLGIRIDSLVYELSPQGGKRWLCPIQGCSKHFPKLSSLKVHLLSHNGIRPYKCIYENCDWAFYTWYKLKRHIETHLKRRDFACSEANCNRRFTTIYNLNTHIRLHQRPKCWMCSVPECTRAYHTRRELEVHMKTHKDIEAPYKCGMDGCSKSYFTPNSLTSHMRSHHKEEELCCQWNGCGKKFDKPCRLKAHMRVHTGQRPFVCTFKGCNWSFQSASKLSRHQRKHTNDRKFTCHLCLKSFLRSEHLKGHLLIHTGVRNFQCPVESCSAKFTAKSSLYVHLKKHDGKAKENTSKVTYHCPIDNCDKFYNSKVNLRQHMHRNHTILTNDTNHLDYIMLLGDKDLMLDPLLPLTSGGTSSSTSALDPHVPSAAFASTSHSTDPHTALLSSIELINGDISSDGNNIAPIIVMEGRGSTDTIESMDVGMAESLMGGTSGTGAADVESLDLQSITSENGGSARTDALGNFIQSQRAKKRQQLTLAKKMAELGCNTSEVVSFTNDVVLSASAVTLSSVSHLQSALLQDDCVGNELYQEALMGHELLSDPTTDPQSTINLRDLE